MGLWHSIKEFVSGSSSVSKSIISESLNDIRKDNIKRDARINKIFNKLNTHSTTLYQLKKELEKLNQLMNELSSKAVREPILPAVGHRPVALMRPNSTTGRLNTPGYELPITNLSPKEKKIIGVLIGHKDMILSYEDIAKVLENSISTVKNQINQIKNKANLLIEIRDETGKKRYKLKDNIRLEKYITTD